MVLPTAIPRSIREMLVIYWEAKSKSAEHCYYMSNIKDPRNACKYAEAHSKEIKELNLWAGEWKLKLAMGVDKRPTCLR